VKPLVALVPSLPAVIAVACEKFVTTITGEGHLNRGTCFPGDGKEGNGGRIGEGFIKVVQNVWYHGIMSREVNEIS